MWQKGFTLIELMIVVAIIGIIASIAIPNIISSRISANETAALATLRELVNSQVQMQQRGVADEDGDGLGEFATFGELAGAVPVRGLKVLAPVLLSTSWGSVNAQGEAVRNGYQYRIYLPGPGGVGIGEVPGGGAPAGLDPDLAESLWCAVAWPTDYQASGARTFYINQSANILFADVAAYDGPGNPPQPGAALDPADGALNEMTGRLMTTGGAGRDGNVWRTAPR